VHEPDKHAMNVRKMCSCGCGSPWKDVHFPKPKERAKRPSRRRPNWTPWPSVLPPSPLRRRAIGVLHDLLFRAGYDVGFTTLYAWPRAWQGDAYLWAVRFLGGEENVPPPEHVTARLDVEVTKRGKTRASAPVFRRPSVATCLDTFHITRPRGES
jgi:hypothetical protein